MRILLLVLFTVFNLFSFAQRVGINNNNPDASAVLDVQSADKGMLIPRMLKAARTGIQAPANGLMVYQSGPDSAGFYYYHNNWHYLNYDSMLPPTAMLLSASYPNARLENNNFTYKGKLNMPGATLTQVLPSINNVFIPIDSLVPGHPTSGAIDFFSTWADSVFYITGGVQATAIPGGIDFYKFNPSTKQWSLTAAPALKVSQGAAQARVGNKWIFWGGYQSSQTGNALGAFTYDFASNSFTQSSLPNDSARRYLTATAIGNNVYFWGGLSYQSSSYNFNTGYIFNSVSNTWTKMNNTNSPMGRMYAGAIAAGSDIVIWGGIQFGGAGVLNNGGIYRTASNTWTTISSVNAPTGGTIEPAMAYYNNNVYIISGSQTKMLNTSSNTWTTLAPPPTAFNGQKFSYDGNGKIMVFGGARYFFPGQPNNTGYIYDIATNSYSSISAGSSLQARAGHTISSNGAGVWMLWGGSNVSGSMPSPEYALKSGALFYLNAQNVLVTQPLGDLFLYEKN